MKTITDHCAGAAWNGGGVRTKDPSPLLAVGALVADCALKITSSHHPFTTRTGRFVDAPPGSPTRLCARCGSELSRRRMVVSG
jgi:hypothetical protein